MSKIDIIISKGFTLSGIMNLSVLFFSRFFTNETIVKYDPIVMSNFGLLMIMVWGGVFLSVSKSFHHLKWLIGIFVIEKSIYGCMWINWLIHHNLSDVYQEDIMAGIFYSIYGINDWLFGLFFFLVFSYLIKSKK
ncbi:hypothetical protein [Phocoenobacter skyensis]|uniref:Uncharacterized protein n=4 Tax=Pasteurellaceae TaxID=712 RepID=A0A1H7VSR6_9PAST|nr:hypothetical protein [Pasteurella skyensis]MDP8078907.1 hypothetical protein [Pasteurella skyensis]MDP8084780.1 hypothetical protein [Pasteurella skyensis]MDP8177076.1 hypothetical protein [Pasteurella skyensis]MDP8184880.1 hypothetical protein [Pasteurella skyensis]MDP8199550.1 hypothetical protein [Pasteurella skyensis]